MNKYWQIFKISFEQEFAYRLNFILWRVRNVFQILLTYFLWDTVFAGSQTMIFGYNRSKMLTYVFGIIIVRALVLSAKAMEVTSDITQGNLSNYLLKPLNYFKYWMTRDIASKFLNLSFAALEFTALFLILKPPFFLQTNLYVIATFLIAIVIAIVIYFCILFITSSIAFWAPELGWGSHFLITLIIVEALSGSLFPINILPAPAQALLLATPFPYLIYFPVQVYLGNITGVNLIYGIMVGIFWVVALWFSLNLIWGKGLKTYEAVGR